MTKLWLTLSANCFTLRDTKTELIIFSLCKQNNYANIWFTQLKEKNKRIHQYLLHLDLSG